jgi:hypothetical protein
MIIVLQIIIETGIITTGITSLTAIAISTAAIKALIGDLTKVIITTAIRIAIPMIAMKATGVTVSR